jgi:hypothetical protein
MPDSKEPAGWRKPWLIGIYMGVLLGVFQVLPMITEGGVSTFQLLAFFGHRLAVCFVIGSAPLWRYGVSQGALLALVLDTPVAILVQIPFWYFFLFALVGGGLTGYIVGRFRIGGGLDDPDGHRG